MERVPDGHTWVDGSGAPHEQPLRSAFIRHPSRRSHRDPIRRLALLEAHAQHARLPSVAPVRGVGRWLGRRRGVRSGCRQDGALLATVLWAGAALPDAPLARDEPGADEGPFRRRIGADRVGCARPRPAGDRATAIPVERARRARSTGVGGRCQPSACAQRCDLRAGHAATGWAVGGGGGVCGVRQQERRGHRYAAQGAAGAVRERVHAGAAVASGHRRWTDSGSGCPPIAFSERQRLIGRRRGRTATMDRERHRPQMRVYDIAEGYTSLYKTVESAPAPLGHEKECRPRTCPALAVLAPSGDTGHTRSSSCPRTFLVTPLTRSARRLYPSAPPRPLPAGILAATAPTTRCERATPAPVAPARHHPGRRAVVPVPPSPAVSRASATPAAGQRTVTRPLLPAPGHGGAGHAVGRRGQGQTGGPALRVDRCGGAVSGRKQRWPHSGGEWGQVRVAPAADRYIAPRGAGGDRERGGGAPGVAV
eukprot:ctg_167.g110